MIRPGSRRHGLGSPRLATISGPPRYCSRAEPSLLGEAAYHCQQAAEKALKGFLGWHDTPFGKTHDLAAIGGPCVVADARLEALCVRADRLSVFAWVFRYPGEPEEPQREEVEGALALAREVFEATLSRLPAELRP